MHPRGEMDHHVHTAQRISPIRSAIDCAGYHHLDIFDRRVRGTQRRADGMSLPKQFSAKRFADKTICSGDQESHRWLSIAIDHYIICLLTIFRTLLFPLFQRWALLFPPLEKGG